MARPRDPELEQRLLETAWLLLTSQGYTALSMSEVASGAGAHRTDVYRRWSSKAQLVVDVLAAHLPPVSPIDTGSLEGDLRVYVADLAATWSAPWIDGFVGLVADARYDVEAELAFRTLAEARGQAARDALARAVERGELSELPDRSLLSGLLEGPLMHRRMIGRALLTPEYLDAVTQAAVLVLTAGVRS